MKLKSYVKRYFGQEFTRLRGGKQQRVVSKPQASPGRTMLRCVLLDGSWSVQRSGAGKVREGVLNETSDVCQKAKQFFGWARENAT